MRSENTQVYKIKNTVTNRVYIGRSRNAPERIKHHLYALRSGNHPVEDMQRDYELYGDSFTFVIFPETDAAEGKKKERELMDKYHTCTRGIGYNYKDPHAKKNELRREYISTIEKKLRQTHDISILDLICQLLDKSQSSKQAMLE